MRVKEKTLWFKLMISEMEELSLMLSPYIATPVLMAYIKLFVWLPLWKKKIVNTPIYSCLLYCTSFLLVNDVKVIVWLHYNLQLNDWPKLSQPSVDLSWHFISLQWKKCVSSYYLIYEIVNRILLEIFIFSSGRLCLCNIFLSVFCHDELNFLYRGSAAHHLFGLIKV